MKKIKNNLLYSFLDELKKHTDYKEINHAQLEKAHSFISPEYINKRKYISRKSFANPEIKDFNSSFYLFSLPIAVRNLVTRDDLIDKSFEPEWNFIAKLSSEIKKNQILSIIIPTGHMTRKSWNSFMIFINEQDVYLNSAIQLPTPLEAFILPRAEELSKISNKDSYQETSDTTSINTTLIFLSKKKTFDLFIGKLIDEKQSSDLALNMINRKNNENLEYGVLTNAETFKSFYDYEFKQTEKKLLTYYDGFKPISLVEVMNELNEVARGELFNLEKNAIYLQKQYGLDSRFNVLTEIDESKHHLYYQLVLDPTVNSKYLCFFFETELGQNSLNVAYRSGGVVIPLKRLYKQAVKDINVIILNRDKQDQMINTHKDIVDVTNKLQLLKKDLYLNPFSAMALGKKLLEVKMSLDTLSTEDQMLADIRTGETKTIEFKETYSLCIKSKKKEKHLIESALKNVCAFLNTKGGHLYLGISDDGTIKGLNEELDKFHKGDKDKFKNRLSEDLRYSIGPEFNPDINYEFITHNDLLVLLITCQPSDRECYLNKKDFYTRQDPAAIKLEGPAMSEYIRKRFYK